MFDSIPHPTADRGDEAVLIFFRMIRARPLSFTVSNAHVACSHISSLREGCQIHGVVVKIGFEGNRLVESSMVTMYAKCGVIEDARCIFDESTSRDVVWWTSMVSGYAECGRMAEAELLFEEMPERNVVAWNVMLAGYMNFFCWDKALNFVYRMRRETKEIDQITLGLILNVCAGMSDLEQGKLVYVFAHRQELDESQIFSNALLNMYVKCGDLRSANCWFIEMALQWDRISWNSLLWVLLAMDGMMNAFRKMLKDTTPSELTCTVLLAACATIFMLEHGKQIPGYIIINGFTFDVIIRGALVDT